MLTRSYFGPPGPAFRCKAFDHRHPHESYDARFWDFSAGKSYPAPQEEIQDVATLFHTDFGYTVLFRGTY